MTYKNLVLSGGGIKGLSIIGAIKYLEDIRILPDIKIYIGSSAGSIISFLAILGYKADEMYKIFCEDYDEIMHIDYDNILNIFETYGVNSQEKYRILLQKYLRNMTGLDDITFKQLFRITSREIIITGSNLTEKRTDFFTKDLNPDMSVIEAILISSCIPIIFYPMKYNNCFYVDGGLFNNFPINYIDPCEADQTIGISLQDAEYRHTDIKNFVEYLNVIIDTLHYKCSYDNVEIDKFKKICHIPFDIDAKFDNNNKVDIDKISKDKMQHYIDCGYIICKNVFNDESI